MIVEERAKKASKKCKLTVTDRKCERNNGANEWTREKTAEEEEKIKKSSCL